MNIVQMVDYFWLQLEEREIIKSPQNFFCASSLILVNNDRAPPEVKQCTWLTLRTSAKARKAAPTLQMILRDQFTDDLQIIKSILTLLFIIIFLLSQ